MPLFSFFLLPPRSVCSVVVVVLVLSRVVVSSSAFWIGVPEILQRQSAPFFAAQGNSLATTTAATAAATTTTATGGVKIGRRAGLQKNSVTIRCGTIRRKNNAHCPSTPFTSAITNTRLQMSSNSFSGRNDDHDSNDNSGDEDLFLSIIRRNEDKKRIGTNPTATTTAQKTTEEKDAAGVTTAQRNETAGEATTTAATFNVVTGAGVPRPSLGPDEIVPLLMNALQNVDVPTVDAGLVAMWDFASDTTKFIFQNNRTEFIESCHETADEFPTSFYGAAMKGRSWAIATELHRVGGDEGWIATQVTTTVSSDGRPRRWQWELRKNKRPPCLGCWRVENVASSDRKGNFEPD